MGDKSLAVMYWKYILAKPRRLASIIEEHGGRCEQSNVTRHSVDSGHNLVQPFTFEILTQIQFTDIKIRKQPKLCLYKSISQHVIPKVHHISTIKAK